jgi:hypothetical protein
MSVSGSIEDMTMRPPGTEHAVELAQQLERVAEVAEDEAAVDAVEAGVGEGEALDGVAVLEDEAAELEILRRAAARRGRRGRGPRG